jgi:DNA ligase-4
MLHITDKDRPMIEANVDEYGDSYCRDISADELKGVRNHFTARFIRLLTHLQIFETMPSVADMDFDSSQLLTQFHDHGIDFRDYPGWMFRRAVIYFDKAPEQSNESTSPLSDLDLHLFIQIVTFAGGRIVNDVEDRDVTHIVVGEDRSRLKELRRTISRFVCLLVLTISTRANS